MQTSLNDRVHIKNNDNSLQMCKLNREKIFKSIRDNQRIDLKVKNRLINKFKSKNTTNLITSHMNDNKSNESNDEFTKKLKSLESILQSFSNLSPIQQINIFKELNNLIQDNDNHIQLLLSNEHICFIIISQLKNIFIPVPVVVPVPAHLIHLIIIDKEEKKTDNAYNKIEAKTESKSEKIIDNPLNINNVTGDFHNSHLQFEGLAFLIIIFSSYLDENKYAQANYCKKQILEKSGIVDSAFNLLLHSDYFYDSNDQSPSFQNSNKITTNKINKIIKIRDLAIQFFGNLTVESNEYRQNVLKLNFLQIVAKCFQNNTSNKSFEILLSALIPCFLYDEHNDNNNNVDQNTNSGHHLITMSDGELILSKLAILLCQYRYHDNSTATTENSNIKNREKIIYLACRVLKVLLHYFNFNSMIMKRVLDLHIISHLSDILSFYFNGDNNNKGKTNKKYKRLMLESILIILVHISKVNRKYIIQSEILKTLSMVYNNYIMVNNNNRIILVYHLIKIILNITINTLSKNDIMEIYLANLFPILCSNLIFPSDQQDNPSRKSTAPLQLNLKSFKIEIKKNICDIIYNIFEKCDIKMFEDLILKEELLNKMMNYLKFNIETRNINYIFQSMKIIHILFSILKTWPDKNASYKTFFSDVIRKCETENDVTNILDILTKNENVHISDLAFKLEKYFEYFMQVLS